MWFLDFEAEIISGNIKVIMYSSFHNTYVSMEHKSIHKQHSYICSNSQQYIMGQN